MTEFEVVPAYETQEVEFIDGEVESESEPNESEPGQQPCVNQLGFIAVCAACPLLRMLGECPKEIREQALNADEPMVEDEPLVFPVTSAVLNDIADVLGSDLGQSEVTSEDIDTPRGELERPIKPKNHIQAQHKVGHHHERKNSHRNHRNSAGPAPKQSQAPKKEVLSTPSYRELLLDDSVPIVTSFSTRPNNSKVEKSPPPVIQEIVSYEPPLSELSPAPNEYTSQPLEDQKEHFIEADTPTPRIGDACIAETFSSKAIMHESTATFPIEPRVGPRHPAPVAIQTTPPKKIDRAVPVIAPAHYSETPPPKDDVLIEIVNKQADETVYPIDAPLDSASDAPVPPCDDKPEQAEVEVSELIKIEPSVPELDAAKAIPHSRVDPLGVEEVEESVDLTFTTPERLTKLVQKDEKTYKNKAHFKLGFWALLFLVKQPITQE